MVGHVLVQPEVVLAAAAELDLLADRLLAAATLSGPATHVLPSGVEEVSLLAAAHFNHAASTHDGAVGQAALELRHAAHTLRMQVAQHITGDVVRATGISAVQV